VVTLKVRRWTRMTMSLKAEQDVDIERRTSRSIDSSLDGERVLTVEKVLFVENFVVATLLELLTPVCELTSRTYEFVKGWLIPTRYIILRFGTLQW
jgi:hypothetical protein